MGKCILFPAAERKFEHLAGPPGEVKVARDTNGLSKTMTCGVVSMSDCNLPWTVKYDEYFYGLKGTLLLHVGDKTYAVGPGDGVWIPDNTKLVYEAKGTAELMVAIYPFDWQDKADDKPGEELPLKLVKPADRVFKPLEIESPGMVLCRDAGPEVSTTMVCGLSTFENARIPWTMRYDEYFYCIEGRMRFREGDEVHEIGPHDAIWLPDGVEIVYEADEKATVAFAVYPIDWRKRAGLE